MHTFKGQSCYIHHNSDLSGDIIIAPLQHPTSEITVSGEDIKAFIAEYIRSRRISELEQMSTTEILK